MKSNHRGGSMLLLITLTASSLFMTSARAASPNCGQEYRDATSKCDEASDKAFKAKSADFGTAGFHANQADLARKAQAISEVYDQANLTCHTELENLKKECATAERQPGSKPDLTVRNLRRGIDDIETAIANNTRNQNQVLALGNGADTQRVVGQDRDEERADQEQTVIRAGVRSDVHLKNVFDKY